MWSVKTLTWLIFSKRNSEDQVVWIDGNNGKWSTVKKVVAPPDVTLISDDTDSLECLQADGFTWTDNDCTTQQQFICEKKIGNCPYSSVLLNKFSFK